ncbi:MAG TPA: site-2 protease family protein [Leptospiraceae bacterium]|nr:site-2 protease family protein [Leptospiraceae bacterium]HMZ57517.1 site-2 protease family protein [Leptospiraceae bacterium]HNF15126.1 site-2 protease family protein [Leptospiraceae bacterium]HNF23981.1 site-2 protease family protein [Leptospiraceae bacterium]HNI94958.1 site-2 protease family protein [Leptospiraceae bacterium]
MLLVIICVVLMLGICIFIHELGHLLCGMLVGVEARIFSIGYGKGVWKKRIGRTVYQITAIPIGGYVMFRGDQYSRKLHKKPGELLSTPPLKRMIPVLGGPFFNLLLGLLIFIVLGFLGDVPPNNRVYIDPAYAPDSPAYIAGIRSGDKILSINGIKTDTFEDIFATVGLSKGEEMTLEVQTGENKKSVKFLPEITEDGIAYIGVSPYGKRRITVNFTYSEQFKHFLKTTFAGKETEDAPKSRMGTFQARAIAYLNDGDEILDVEGKEVSTVGELQALLGKYQGKTVSIRVLRKNYPLLTPYSKREETVKIPVLGADILELKNITDVKTPELNVKKYTIQSYDPKIDQKLQNLKINGTVYKKFDDLKNYLLEERGDEEETAFVPLDTVEVGGREYKSSFRLKPIGLLGFRPGVRLDFEEPENPIGALDAVKLSFYKIYQNVSYSLQGIKMMVTGMISVKKNMSGPIGIAHVAGLSLEQGFMAFMDFFARISIALMIMNLLPIPVADGGHIVLYLYEAVTGKPLPPKAIETIFKLGFIFLLGLGLFVTFYDFMRFVE